MKQPIPSTISSLLLRGLLVGLLGGAMALSTGCAADTGSASEDSADDDSASDEEVATSEQELTKRKPDPGGGGAGGGCAGNKCRFPIGKMFSPNGHGPR